MREFAVVFNECARPPLANVLAVRTHDTANGLTNFTSRFDGLAAGLPGPPLDKTELDWLEILASIYAVDLACDRGRGDTNWARDIRAFIAVRDPDRWRPLATAFQELFNDLTYDRLRIEFCRDEGLRTSPRQKDQFAESDCVALLSGGVDSFAGAARLLAEGRAPLYVAHQSGGISRYQRHAEGGLRTLDAGRPFVGFGAEAVRKDATFPGSEGSQRSRTMLYMGAAALVAARLEVEQVYLNENGVMAVHVPISAARVGSLSTRTASPFALERMSRLASEALGRPVRLENKLIRETKPQVVAGVVSQGLEGTLKDLVSCWMIGRQARHCGICGPCLMRQISLELHNVDDAIYDNYPFDDPSVMENPIALDNLSQLCQFVNELGSLSNSELYVEYGELLDGAPVLEASESIELYRRWGQEASEILKRHSVPTRFLA
jgi:7-cyano-7-deazaguanine synthase in queuosine biosynthesis